MASAQKSKPTYATAIIGVSLVLFLLGTLGWLVLNARSLTRVFKEGVEVQVVLHDNVRPEKAKELEGIVKSQGFVREVNFTSKEDAAKNFEKEWGEDFSQLLDFNPLYSSLNFKLYSDYVNNDSLQKIESFLKQSNIVRDVTYEQGVVEQMNTNFRKIGLILGGISLLLFIVVIILIDNTVRLAMFSNRFLIKTMQMVGATRYFISKPFDRRAIINGLISGIIAVVGLWLVISLAENELPDLRALHEPALLGMLMAGMIILGILISLVSTHRSVLKYLKMHVDDLY